MEKVCMGNNKLRGGVFLDSLEKEKIRQKQVATWKLITCKVNAFKHH